MQEMIGKKNTIKIVSPSEERSIISERDMEMDRRAVEAVKKALDKAKFCKKPIAKYDKVTKRAYIEYEDGKKNYVG